MKKHLLAALVVTTGSILYAADEANPLEQLDQWKESLAAAQQEWRLRRLHPTTRDKCLEVMKIIKEASFDLSRSEDVEILDGMISCVNEAVANAEAYAKVQEKIQVVAPQKALLGLKQKLAVNATPSANAAQDDQKAVKPTEKPESKKKSGSKKAA